MSVHVKIQKGWQVTPSLIRYPLARFRSQLEARSQKIASAKLESARNLGACVARFGAVTVYDDLKSFVWEARLVRAFHSELKLERVRSGWL